MGPLVSVLAASYYRMLTATRSYRKYYITNMEYRIDSNHILSMFSKFGVTAAGYLRVEVQDSGVGITSENQCRVLDGFTQFDRTQLQGGGYYILKTECYCTYTLYCLASHFLNA